MSEIPVPADDIPKKKQGRRTRRGFHSGVWTWITASLLGIVIVGAPLALGAVHRPVVLAVLAAGGLLAVATARLAWCSEQSFRQYVVLVLPLCFVAIAALQSMPLPTGLRSMLDPVGSDLAALNRVGAAVPMSLDPPETHKYLAKSGLAVAVAFAALVLSAGRRMRLAVPVLVAAAGVATLAVGLGHRAVFESKIYGTFAASDSVPLGPFINPNHEAELLELAAFAALAVAYAASTRDRRRVWQAVAAILAAGALSTVSRGAVLALGAGGLTWMLFPWRSDDDAPRSRNRFVAVLLGLIVVAGLTLSLGGEAIFREVWATSPGTEGKFRLWLDALKIVPAHPLGIGLGAFARVFPAYQTLPTSVWYQFVENQPLGLLIEAGVPGLLLVTSGFVLTVRHLAKYARRDRVEAALCAALVAVLAHNLVDFGLEIPGILMPFLAIAGTIVARQQPATDTPASRRNVAVHAGIAVAAMGMGSVLMCVPAARDFDKLLKEPPGPSRPALIRAAQAAHPTDNEYALLAATLEPLQSPDGGSSPRLRGLNRALRLCPNCITGHREVARVLWRLGRRQQALMEWRTVVVLNRALLVPVLDELKKGGAQPAELASLVDDENRFEVCRYLIGQRMFQTAKDLLASSTNEGIEFHLVNASLALAEHDIAGARQASRGALAIGPADARAARIAAEVEIQDQKLDAAIEFARRGLHAAPTDIELNRTYLALLIQTDQWQAVDRAIDGFRAALLENGVSSVEANLAAAQVHERRGQYPKAVAEYRAAVAQRPGDVGLLLSLGRLAEKAGQVTVALDAYREVLRWKPDNAAAQSALGRMKTEVEGQMLEGMLRSRRP